MTIFTVQNPPKKETVTLNAAERQKKKGGSAWFDDCLWPQSERHKCLQFGIRHGITYCGPRTNRRRTILVVTWKSTEMNLVQRGSSDEISVCVELKSWFSFRLCQMDDGWNYWRFFKVELDFFPVQFLQYNNVLQSCRSVKYIFFVFMTPNFQIITILQAVNYEARLFRIKKKLKMVLVLDQWTKLLLKTKFDANRRGVRTIDVWVSEEWLNCFKESYKILQNM